MNKIKRLFKLAAEVASLNDKNGVNRQFRVGAVAVRQDGVIVSASNLPVFGPTPPAHAEARVLDKATANAIIYVVRVDSFGRYTMAKPCRHCLSKMIRYNVKRCYYTISEHEYGVIRF